MKDLNAVRKRFAARCRFDPLRFVMGAFPWGEKGAAAQRFPALAVCPLPEPYKSQFPKKTHGPLKWQLDFLRDLGAAMVARSFDAETNRAVAPIRMAVQGSRGSGKSTLSAWVSLWVFYCWPGSKWSVISDQLAVASWPEIGRWRCVSVFSDIGHYGNSSRRRRLVMVEGAKDHWVQGRTSRTGNAIAGNLAPLSVNGAIVDGACGLGKDDIVDVFDQQLTDGQGILLLFANPVHPSGAFYDRVEGPLRSEWGVRRVTAFECEGVANVADARRRLEEFGANDPGVRVSVLGEFPGG